MITQALVSTINQRSLPNISPTDWLLFRGSYNTGFRVPTFNQIFNGQFVLPSPGNSLVDPTTCPTGIVSTTVPGCNAITPDTLNGGNLDLGPETSKQFSVGVLLQPTSRISLGVDYWNIAVDNTIGTLSTQQLFQNIAAFGDRIQRTNGVITGLDLRTGNFGSRRTEGLEISARASFDALGGDIGLGMDGTYLLNKREKLLPSLPYTDLVGIFTLFGDVGPEVEAQCVHQL